MNLINVIFSYFGYVKIDKKAHNASIQLAFNNLELLRKVTLKLPEFKPHYEAQRELVEYLRSLRKLV